MSEQNKRTGGRFTAVFVWNSSSRNHTHTHTNKKKKGGGERAYVWNSSWENRKKEGGPGGKQFMNEKERGLGGQFSAALVWNSSGETERGEREEEKERKRERGGGGGTNLWVSRVRWWGVYWVYIFVKNLNFVSLPSIQISKVRVTVGHSLFHYLKFRFLRFILP